MGRRLEQLERMLERRSRGGHPFRPRLSWKRRWAMMVFFVLLCTVIGGYWYLTDADRVRTMAETYLTKVLGGRVEVGQANLSIFEGLRLDDVRVHVDQGDGEDSVLFRAKTFKVDYNPRALVVGRIESGQIVALGPELRVVQDRETGEWNFQQIIAAARKRGPTTRKSTAPSQFPEILLRDGRIENGEQVAGEYRALGTLGFEGRLSPTGDAGRYAFELRCHGLAESVGPSVAGWFVPDTGQFRIKLRDLAFGRDVRGMLPLEVRQWWEGHALAGVIDATDVFHKPAVGDKPAEWRVETTFKGVTLRIKPEEWRSKKQNLAMQHVRDATEWTRALSLGSEVTWGARLFKFTRSVPINLEQGEGTLAFDSSGLEIKELRGMVEGSHIGITGRYDGTSPDGALQMHIQSLPPEHIVFADQPQFIWSMPSDVLENWQRFHPVGSLKLSMDVTRGAAGGAPRVKGVMDIIDGYFTCDRFPYTCRKPSGQIVLDVDPDHGGGTLELNNLQGYGQVGGVNENKVVKVSGLIDHLGPDLGMHLEISAEDMISDRAVLAAIPPDVQSVITLFDAPGRGEYPRFQGGFKCWIDRPVGKDQHIDVNIDLDIRNGSGRVTSFPYPLENFSARAEIRDDYVDIPWSKMKRGETELALSGRVRWKDFKKTGDPIGTRLKIAVKNMGIDQDLMNALTPVRRQWLQKVGLGGKLDFDGRIFSDQSEKDIVVDLGLNLHEGTIWPTADGPTLSGLAGKLHLNRDEIELQDVVGHRGPATVTVGGLVSWKDEKPKVALKGKAVGLPLDAALYKLLPDAAHEAWDAVAPVGTIDAEATFAGGEETADLMQGFALTVRPRKLSVTPKAVPYRLDDLAGEVNVAGGKVTLKKLTGTHGKGTVALSGAGAIDGPGAWTLAVTGKDLAVDEAFLKGVPEAVGGMLKGIEYKGPISFDVPKLVYRGAPAGEKSSAQNAIGDIDFAGTLSTAGASINPGMPVTDLTGKVDVRGAVRAGRLEEVAGTVAVESMKLAGREASDVRAEFARPAGSPELHVSEIRGDVAGGTIAGEASVSAGDFGPTHYKTSMVLRDADVRTVSRDDSMNGTFTGSMELEGTAGDPKSRIGRGDVLANGKEMYQVPLLMGLLQVTNLSLPFTSPFKSAQAQYILPRNQITFENIELRGDSIVMQGGGTINFDNKQVRLTFNTDSPTHWVKVPIVADLFQSAKRELFQINVNGTVEEPKVSASPFHTVRMTVDQVLKGGK